MTNEDPRATDARVVEAVRERFAAPSLTREQTAAFDRRLAKRIAKPHFEVPWRSLGVAATASAVLFVWLIGLPDVEPLADPIATRTDPIASSTPSREPREELRFDPTDEAVLELGTAALANLEDSLPDEYRAIDELFLGEV